MRECDERLDSKGELTAWGVGARAFLEFCKDMHWETTKSPLIAYELIFKQASCWSVGGGE